METKILLLAVLVTGALAGPINVRYGNDNTMCAQRCTESSKFRYRPGMTYDFDYNVQTLTTMKGAAEEKATLGLKATAHVEILSKCELALQLRDVQVYQSDPTTAMKPVDSSEFRSALESHPLRFAFQDGVVEDLCPESGETSWALNIKRGVLSTFQNAMDSFEGEQSVHENDVTGRCVTSYKAAKSWYTTTVSKSKNLLACTDRQDFRSVLRTIPYRVPSDIQSLPLIKSDHECTQEIDKSGGYLKTAVCKESHVFRPFAQQQNGALTKIIQKLTYKTQRSGVSTRTGSIARRENMLFEHAKGPVSSEMKKQEVERKLQEICETSRNDIRPEVPMQFSELVFVLRNLNTAAMRDIYTQLTRGSLCRGNLERTKKIFIDSIPMVSTSSSVEMMKELLLNKEVTGLTAEMWLTTLAFIQAPTRDMLVHAKSMLEMRDMEMKAMLPISSLVNNFCSRTENCADMSEVSDIINIFERALGRGCYVRDSNLEKVMLVIRAIGNAGNSDTIGSTALNSCFARSSNPMEVRVAALDAFRRLPCTSDRSEPMTIFQDKSEDSELRIAAYLAVMVCPTEDVLSMVKSTLQAEEANQVGSFVWSHLTNLMETSSPHKQAVRAILEDARLKSEFNMEKLKYSRNYEGSFMLDKINTGALVESNVIWSSKSFIPRSAMLNLTVDLFGNSVNLMEMGGRIEGLEYLLETYLGPLGYFGEKTDKPIVKSRAKLDELRGSMYMRMFGNEMAFTHFKGLDSFPKMESYKKKDLLKMLSGEHEYSFTQNIMFLDSSIIVPTAAGMPLNLTLNGVATVDIQAKGKLDLNGLFNNPMRAQIEGQVKPSGAVAITGCMTVDAFVTKAGLRMTSTLHTSTATKGRILLHGTKIVSAEFDMPEDKMEILDVKTAFFVVHGDIEKEQKMITDNRKVGKVCTGSKLAKITGLEVCGEVSFPNASMMSEAPYFPFTGPVGVSLVLHKRDSHLGYRFLAKKTLTPQANLVQLAIDTPGSRIDRSLAFDFILNKAAKDLEIKMISPWKKASTKATLINTSDKKAMNAVINIDDEPWMMMDAETKIMDNGARVSYQPTITFYRPAMGKITATGKIIREGRSCSGDITLGLPEAEDSTLAWSAINENNEKSIGMNFNYQKQGEYSGLVKLAHESGKGLKLYPTIQIRTPKASVAMMKGSCEYMPGKFLNIDTSIASDWWLRKPMSCTCKLNRIEKRRNQVKYMADVLLDSKLMTMKIDGNVDMKKSGLSSRVIVDYNMPRSKKNKITFNTKYNDRTAKTLTKHTLTTNFEVKRNPEYNFDSKVDFSHNSRHTDGKLDISVGQNPDNKLYLEASTAHKGSLKVAAGSFDGKAIVPLLGVNAQLKAVHKHNDGYLGSNVNLEYAKGKSVSADLKLKDDSKKTTKMGGVFTLSYPGNNVVISSGLTQPSKKELQHTLNVNIGANKSSIVTVYKQPRHESHEFSSDINIHSMEPMSLSGETNLNLKNFKALGHVIYAGDKYGVATISKYSPSEPRGKITVDLIHPSREIGIVLDGKKSGTKYSGSLETKWDAAKDKSRRVILDGMMNMKSLQDLDGTVELKYPSRNLVLNLKHSGDKKYVSHVDFAWSPKEQITADLSFGQNLNDIATALSLITPFEMMPRITADIAYTNDPSKYSSVNTLTWGKSGDQITTSLSLKKPVSLSNIDLSMKASTPFTGLKRLQADIAHTIADDVKTVVKGSIGSTNAQLEVVGANKGTYHKTDMSSGMTWKSNIPEFETISINGKIMNENNQYVAELALDKNGERYMGNLDTTFFLNGIQMQSRGSLMLAAPSQRLRNSWSHRNTDSDIKSSWTSDWRGNKVYINLSGMHQIDASRTVKGDLTIQTPLEALRDIEMSLNHRHTTGSLANVIIVKKDRRPIAASKVNYQLTASNGEMEIVITNPYTDDLSSKANFRGESFPMTGHLEMEWSPRSQINMDGSVTYAYPLTLDGSVRFTTPFEAVRSVVLQATNKHVEGRTMDTTAMVEYAPRERIELDSRVRFDHVKQMNLKLRTPFNNMKAMDTMMSFAKSPSAFDSSMELEILPIWGKFSSMVNANWASDMSGKLRMDTPYSSFPYLQMEATSNLVSTGRHSSFEAEYSPRQIISVQSTYNLDGPITMDINLNSPYQYIENVGGLIKHDSTPGNMVSHAEIRYSPSETIEGDLSMKWDNDVVGMLVVKTPFENYETSKLSFRQSGPIDDFTAHGEVTAMKKTVESDVTFSNGGRKSVAEFIFRSPFENFEMIKAKGEVAGRLDKAKVVGTFNYGHKEIQAVLRNSFSSRRLDTVFTLRTPFTDNLKFVIDHDGDMTRFTNKITANLGRQYNIATDTTFDMRLPTVDLTTSLVYRLPIESRRVAFTAHKEGEWDNLNAYITGNCNGKEITVRSSLNAQNGVDGSLSIVSPYSDDIVITMNHNGEWSHFTTKASANMGSNYIVSTDNTFHMDLPAVDITNTMSYRMNGQGRELALQTHADKQLDTWTGKVTASVDGEEYSTSGMMQTAEPMEASVTINTPISDYREVGAVVTHKGSLSRFASSGSIKYMDSQKIEGNVDFFADGMNRIDATAIINTPFTNYERTEYKYNQNMDEKSLSSHAEINYGYSQKIVADIVAALEPTSTARVTITTPFEGFEMNKLILNGKGSVADFTADGEIEFNGEKVNIDSAFSHDAATTGRFSLLATSPSVKDVVVDFSRNGDLSDFTCTGKARVGRRSVADVSVAGRFLPEQKSLSMNLKNPFTEEIMASFSHDGPMMNCVTEIKGSVGRETFVNGKMTVVSRNNYFEAATTGNYMLIGYGDSFNANIKAEGPMSQRIVTVRCSHGDATIDGSVSYNLNRGVVVDAALSTPMESFRNLAFNLKHRGPVNKFTTQSSLRYMDGSEISGKFDFYNYMLSTLKSSLEVNTPFSGYESSKMSYEHSLSDSSFTGNGNVEYGRGQVVSAEVRLAQQPKYAVDVTIITPFSGYESTIYSASAESLRNHHMADASFKMGDYKAYTMNADLNMNASPITGSLKVYTPFEILRNVDMTMSHSGDLSNFRSFGSMETPLTGKMTGEANMMYTSPFVMDGAIILKSNLPEMEELKLAVRNSESDKKRSHIELGWQPTKQITLDGGYKYATAWYTTEYNGDISIATPFDILRDASIKSISKKVGKKYTNKMEATYNHETVLDMDSELSTEAKCEGSLTMHKPRPVEFTWASVFNEELANSNIFINWNKDEPNSNLRLLANSKLGAAKDLDIKLVHPLRTVALKGNFHNSGIQTVSQGEFSWDEQLGRKVFYNLDVSDNSRGYRKMYDASLKVGAPSRSVEMRGSYGDVRSTKSLNTALLWDADRDTSKQIGFKGNFIPSDKSHKADVVINLPNNLQDIKIGAEMTIDNGRTLFDGKTEFSYSTDARKTLVLSSNLQDVSYDRQYNNYSLSLGIRHPYTDTDVEITSHIGSSSEKLASGVQMKYLTASRRRINLALLGDIDRLRKQINLQVVSPLKNIEMTGEVKSMEPYQIVVNSRVDGLPAALAAVSFDAAARSFHLESNYDLDDMSNMFHIEAKYVNDSAIQAEAYLDGRSRRSESLLSMALETPRIIQARVHWRPEMMSDMKHYAAGQWRRLSTKMGSSLTEISESVGQEIGQKYRVVAESISVELEPYVEMMVREMEDLERELTRISNDLRRMHYNNDYYMRSMGDTAEQYFLSALESYRQAIVELKYNCKEMTGSMSQVLEDIKTFPIRSHYTQLVDSMVENIAMMMESAMESSAGLLENIDEQLKVVAEQYNAQTEMFSNKISDSMNSINSHPRMEAIRSKLAEIRAVDYIGKMKEHLASYEIPQIPTEYTDIIYNAREVINNHLNDVMKRQEVKYIQDATNEVYQQGKWAIAYWKIEENIEARLREFVALVKEIFEDEMKQYYAKFSFLNKSKVEVYEPEKGEIAVELYLPMPLSNLKEMPDTDAYVAEIKDLVVDYTPSLNSITKMYENYAPTIFNNSTDNMTPVQVQSMPSIRKVRQQRRRRSS